LLDSEKEKPRRRHGVVRIYLPEWLNAGWKQAREDV
jgi:hypothetical protein